MGLVVATLATMGLFDRLRGRTTTPDPAPEPALDPEELEWEEQSLRERARVELATATEPFEGQLGLLEDVAEGLPPDRVREIVREVWDERVRLAREHAHDDQSAAVRRAFGALSGQGIASGEAMGWDNDEGHDEMGSAAAECGAPGYVFFHHQDVERIADGPGTLHLRYAATRYESTTAAGKYAEDEAIGRRVVAALEAQGLRPTWDGSGQSTITLEDLRWYPMPGEYPED